MKKAMTDLYLKSERRNGERLKPDEKVPREYVENFTKKETREFFESLGGTEEYYNKKGVIYVKSTSPDGTEVREVVFTPLPGR